MPTPRVERRISVYECGATPKGPCSTTVTHAEAWKMVYVDLVAKWVNKAKGIQMLFGKAALKVRDRSCSMGPRIIELNAMGDEAAMAIVAAWEPLMVPSVYQEAA